MLLLKCFVMNEKFVTKPIGLDKSIEHTIHSEKVFLWSNFVLILIKSRLVKSWYKFWLQRNVGATLNTLNTLNLGKNKDASIIHNKTMMCPFSESWKEKEEKKHNLSVNQGKDYCSSSWFFVYFQKKVRKNNQSMLYNFLCDSNYTELKKKKV